MDIIIPMKVRGIITINIHTKEHVHIVEQPLQLITISHMAILKETRNFIIAVKIVDGVDIIHSIYL